MQPDLLMRFAGYQLRREPAIEIIQEWLALPFLDEPHARLFDQQLVYDLFIFFGLKAACAVNKHAIAF